MCKHMLKSDLAQTDKHSTSNLLQPKNFRFFSCTNLIKIHCGTFEETPEH